MARRSQDIKRQLATNGVALIPVTGGPQKHRYFTPSGNEVFAIPSIRQWVQKDGDGRVVASGERDANLDKGWTTSMPSELKLHCVGCDRWHDTEAEVAECIDKKSAFATKWDKKAADMRSKEIGEMEVSGEVNERLEALEEGLGRIEDLLRKALGDD